MKKEGGKIIGWQIHTLSSGYQKKYADTLGKILTGTVVDDPAGRWRPGMHMRSSLIVSITDTVVETMNTIYHLEGNEGDSRIPEGDLGDAVLNIFY